MVSGLCSCFIFHVQLQTVSLQAQARCFILVYKGTAKFSLKGNPELRDKIRAGIVFARSSSNAWSTDTKVALTIHGHYGRECVYRDRIVTDRQCDSVSIAGFKVTVLIGEIFEVKFFILEPSGAKLWFALDAFEKYGPDGNNMLTGKVGKSIPMTFTMIIGSTNMLTMARASDPMNR